PRGDVRLRPRIDAPRGDPGELERPRPTRAEDADRAGEPSEDAGAVDVALEERRDGGGVEPAAGADRRGRPVERGRPPGAAREQLVRGRVVDGARDGRAGLLQADGDAPVRDAGQEVEGAVDAVDDPAAPVRALGARAL